MTRVYDHDGAAVKARNLDLEPGQTTGNRTRTKPVGNLSDWAIQHNRPGPIGPNLSRLPCGWTACCFTDSPPLF